MADQKTINTRIVLRNDTLANWNASDKVLLKGEAALARMPDSNNFQLRIGTGDKKWRELEPSNVIIPVNNISGLGYADYQLSSLKKSTGEAYKFQLAGKDKVTGAWSLIGDEPIVIPEADFGPVNDKISHLSGVADDLSVTLKTVSSDYLTSADKTELSSTLSTYTDTSITSLDLKLTTVVSNVSAEALLSAASTAQGKANQALANAKAYTNQVSADLSTDYQGQIDKIKSEIADGIHFIGHVYSFDVTKEGETVVGGWYKLTESGDQIAAKNGDLIIHNRKEYIWSDAQKRWDEFGDEGNYATKDYVDDKASTAESNAISATQNNVYQETGLTDDEVTNYLSAGTRVKGDVLINKIFIATGADDSIDKYEYTAYSWDGTAWKAMDGNYNAENVYFDENLKIAGTFGDVFNISHTAKTVKSIETKGKSVKDLFDMMLKGTELYPAKAVDNKPTCRISMNAITEEIGLSVIPTLTFNSFSAKTYTYGSNTLSAHGTSTGVTLAKNWLSYKSLKETEYTAIEDMVKGTSKSMTTDKYQILSTTAYEYPLTASLSTDYNAADAGTYIPKTTLDTILSGDDMATYRTASGQCIATCNGANITGRYYVLTAYFETKKINPVTGILSSNLISMNASGINVVPTAKTGFTKQWSYASSTGTLLGAMQQWYVIARHGTIKSISVKQQTPPAPHTVKMGKIKLPTANYYSDETYDVFYIDNTGVGGANKYDITVTNGECTGPWEFGSDL